MPQHYGVCLNYRRSNPELNYSQDLLNNSPRAQKLPTRVRQREAEKPFFPKKSVTSQINKEREIFTTFTKVYREKNILIGHKSLIIVYWYYCFYYSLLPLIPYNTSFRNETFRTNICASTSCYEGLLKHYNQKKYAL